MSHKSKTKRIFINNVTGFESKHIAKYLSKCVVGASQEDGDDDSEEIEEGEEPKKKTGTYEIYATSSEKDAKKPDYVKELFNFSSREELYDHVVECDVILYDINDDPTQIDEAVWLVSALHADADKLMRKKIFILISSTMTWAKTRPLDPEDPEIPFTEEDFRRRKPFPSYKEHFSAEKAVLKGGKATKGKLSTYVIAAGLTFGEEQNIFHYLFKAAWHNQFFLPVIAPGDNVLPTIHIRDLAAVVQNIADSPPKTYYLVAVCETKNTLEDITRAVSRKLTTGKVKAITREEAVLQEFQQNDLDLLTTSLRIDASYIKDSMRIQWAAETGLPDAINGVVNEYRLARKLVPLRLCILGPPTSGKTTIAHQLAERYKIHHIKMKDVIDGAINELERLAARSTAGAAGAEEQAEEIGEDEEQRIAEAGELLEQVIENQKENNGRLEEQYVLRFFKEKLLSKPCQNQGFVLDGFPKSMEQASTLFQVDDSEEEEEDNDKKLPYNAKIMPEYVFLLQASDEFLRQRIITLPDSVVQGTHNTEEQFYRRITDYRALNSEDDTVLNYFDELEFHPISIDVTKDTSTMSRNTVERLAKLVGPPRNYGPTPEELEQMRMVEEERRAKQEEEARLLRERQEANEHARKSRSKDEWSKRLETVQREEQEMLDNASMPLRNYLMKNVMPSLTRGLMDCVKTRPDDPIDFIAEYLFRTNPQS